MEATIALLVFVISATLCDIPRNPEACPAAEEGERVERKVADVERIVKLLTQHAAVRRTGASEWGIRIGLLRNAVTALRKACSETPLQQQVVGLCHLELRANTRACLRFARPSDHFPARLQEIVSELSGIEHDLQKLDAARNALDGAISVANEELRQ